jgi:hypothetical protein
MRIEIAHRVFVAADERYKKGRFSANDPYPPTKQERDHLFDAIIFEQQHKSKKSP